MRIERPRGLFREHYQVHVWQVTYARPIAEDVADWSAVIDVKDAATVENRC